MLNFIEEKMKSLTEEELKQCWEDIQEYNKEGMMGNTFTRQIRNELAKNIDNGWDSDCRVVTIPEILYEIVRRHYSNK